MLSTISVWFLCISAATAVPTTPNINQRTCTNHLSNPSFESGAISPWLPIVQSAWSPDRGVFPSPSPNEHGKYRYYAHATSTVESSLSMSQSGIALPVGSTVDCYAWVSGSRSENVTSVSVFLDGVTCGTAELGVGEQGWKRVGSRVRVVGGAPGVGSTMAVVAASKGAGEDGWEILLDDMGVVRC